MGPKNICHSNTSNNRSICGSLQIKSRPYLSSISSSKPSSFDETMLTMENGCKPDNRKNKNVEMSKSSMCVLEQWFRQRLANWVQCAGHEGTILPATETTIWKKRVCKECNNEPIAYSKIMKDPLVQNLAPKFYQEVFFDGNYYMELEDLTKKFNSPCIIDIKMGERTFLESEVYNSVKRRDLYEKMIAINPLEPSDQENDEKAITKLRYMQFREKESSSSSLGFRIEAMKNKNEKQMNSHFVKCRTKSQVANVLDQFCNSPDVRKKLLLKLKAMRSQMEKSKFFKTHEIIGSSLLIMYDENNIGVWLIDFAKTVPLPEGTVVTHRNKWKLGNHEDGYLNGLDTLIKIFEEDRKNVE